MKHCPFCAEEIQDAAVVCKHCGRDLVPRGPAALLEHSSRGRICGLIGAGLLAIGVFLPIARLPILGSINYFRNGSGDGSVVLVVAAIAGILALRKRLGWLLPCAAVSLVLLTVVWLQFSARIAEFHDKMTSELADNPFSGIAVAMSQSAQLEWMGCDVCWSGPSAGRSFR